MQVQVFSLNMLLVRASHNENARHWSKWPVSSGVSSLVLDRTKRNRLTSSQWTATQQCLKNELHKLYLYLNKCIDTVTHRGMTLSRTVPNFCESFVEPHKRSTRTSTNYTRLTTLSWHKIERVLTVLSFKDESSDRRKQAQYQSFVDFRGPWKQKSVEVGL